MSTPRVDIRKLTPEERLRLIEELWESLSQDPSGVPVSQAQRDELDRRLDELEADGGVGIPWDEVLTRIQERRR